MMITLELSEEEVHVLRPLANAAGVNLESVLHQMIALFAPQVPEMPKKLDEEVTEDKAKTQDKAGEDAEWQREQEEMQANIKRWHAEKEAS